MLVCVDGAGGLDDGGEALLRSLGSDLGIC